MVNRRSSRSVKRSARRSGRVGRSARRSGRVGRSARRSGRVGRSARRSGRVQERMVEEQGRKPSKRSSRRGSKKLSPYNIFMSKELKKLKIEHPDWEHKDRFKEAVNRWKAQ